MDREPVSPAVRLDTRRLRVYVDQQLEDDSVVPVLVLVDGVSTVELAAVDARSTVLAVRMLLAESRVFMDRVEPAQRQAMTRRSSVHDGPPVEDAGAPQRVS